MERGADSGGREREAAGASALPWRMFVCCATATEINIPIKAIIFYSKCRLFSRFLSKNRMKWNSAFYLFGFLNWLDFNSTVKMQADKILRLIHVLRWTWQQYIFRIKWLGRMVRCSYVSTIKRVLNADYAELHLVWGDGADGRNYFWLLYLELIFKSNIIERDDLRWCD